MSKSHQRLDGQQSIFDLLRSIQPEPPTEGRCRVIERLRGALRSAIKASPLSRHQIAGEMSHLLSETITKEMIDSWTREDQEAESRSQESEDRRTWIPDRVRNDENWAGRTDKKTRRHVPAEYLPAFCKATGSMEPLRLLGETAGLFVFPGEDAMRAEIQKLSEQMKEMQAEIRKRQVFLKEMQKK